MKEREIIEVETRPCVVCKKRSKVRVYRDELIAWRSAGPYDNNRFIQVAMPEMSVDNRELLISGTHADCYDELWKDL